MTDTDLLLMTGAADAGPAIGKFAGDGVALPYPGTTVVCHIDPVSADFAALVALRDRLRAAAPPGAMAWLPSDSFHMTLFDCTNETRRGSAAWPHDVPPSATVAECAAILQARLAGLTLPARFRVAPTRVQAGRSLRLTGADPAAETALREARNRLSEALRLRGPDHDSYGFHVTLAYRLRPLTLAEADRLLAEQAEAWQTFRSACPDIALGRPEFCTFATLHRFDRLAYL